MEKRKILISWRPGPGGLGAVGHLTGLAAREAKLKGRQDMQLVGTTFRSKAWQRPEERPRHRAH
jgi:hypothetical protein